MERLPELGMLSYAIAANRHQVAVMDEPIDERGRHDVIAENVAPFFEAFVRREHGGGVLVATRHQLKEQHGAGNRRAGRSAPRRWRD